MPLQLRSLVSSQGVLELSLADIDAPVPRPDQVVVRVEATPINPSDLGLLFGTADMSTADASGTPDRPVVTARVAPQLLQNLTARLDQSMAVGNEGAGVVVDAGSNPEAQALIGKTVAILGGAMYAQVRCIEAKRCLVLPEGTTPAEGASCFVNPLTVLGMVETMRLEGHTALVHTAAASNLGQMLNRVCIQEDIGLVNIVRKAEHVDLLQGLGASHVCNSSAEHFPEQLRDALIATGATLAFDATGGGTLASQILTAMEAAAMASATEYTRYGSTTHKQVYIYGGLDRSPTELIRNFGMAWGIGGWLLPQFLQKIGPEAAQKLRERVAAEIKTTFASVYTKEVSLAEALQLDAISIYGKQATGEKFLIVPSKDQ
ncbi:MAG: NADPH2:quinone reductase [Chloroflexi bacterium]|jgi:NADPH2:quinone reductase|nr:MAG: NADPH2:quinone reductase [Chloroflexota bacterium]